jgi:hypothetical protein
MPLQDGYQRRCTGCCFQESHVDLPAFRMPADLVFALPALPVEDQVTSPPPTTPTSKPPIVPTTAIPALAPTITAGLYVGRASKPSALRSRLPLGPGEERTTTAVLTSVRGRRLLRRQN